MIADKNDPRYKKLRDYLKEERIKRGLLQSDLAEKLGVHQQMISKIESGERRIDVVEFICLAEAIGIGTQDAMRILEKS
ncbi:helix-turn-helix domain-containing protein [Kordiimonas lacus]|uniref:Helix-turn-helix n=1 Tax=Kordiimonas lacus TaxID=637679 RepID=A0A1G6TFN5_9PROT|nr:helix-turn-helix transcriptional regulator [Kordiimonas lacus]SDD27873.1 Helix-turn-helix [Kordiimonas lacus]